MSQIRYDHAKINFSVEAARFEDMKKMASDKLRKVTEGIGTYDVEYDLSPLVVQESVVVLWRADVEARRVSA